MASLIQFVQVLNALGPNLPAAWRLISALVDAHSGGQRKHFAAATLSPDEQHHLNRMHQLMADHGGLAASSFGIQDVLRIFNYLQQHQGELLAAVNAIIALFKAIRPTPAPAPTPDPSPAPPAAI